MFHSSNPALRNDKFIKAPTWDELGNPAASGIEASARTMTMTGTVIKSAILLAVCAITAGVAWGYLQQNTGLVGPAMIGGMIGGLVLYLVMMFAQRAAPFLAIPYAACQGLFVGALSLVFAERFGPTLIFQGVLLTFGVMAALLMAYAFRLIRVGPVLQRVVIVGMLGVMLYAVVILVCNALLGMALPNLFDVNNTSALSIGFSLFCVGLGALCLVMDFQFVEEGSRAGLPKHMEWYGAFALLATLVWLYIEILRLLAKLQNRE